ncbi:hypothetical protein [Streptomyces sp. NPDC029003]|uniref:hypothetical protein n=1 Tax=Streptomyces sp. NPDC029003 TaxID=3155125 RepID=UPI003400985F
MPFNRALPPSPYVSLALALLVLTTGCVTVRAEPARVPASAPARPVVRELPLGPLPASAPPPQTPAPIPAPVPVTSAAPAAAPERGDAPRTHAPARRAAAPAPAAKPRTRQPARRPGPRPAPGPGPRRTFDMAPLCEAARGTVSPSIVALCH